MSSPDDDARAFLQTAHLYQLGHLVTESRHPLTRDLSTWAKDDLPRAYAALSTVDRDALGMLRDAAPAIAALGVDLRGTLARGGRIFLCGCGATGRLALLLESLWREALGKDDDRVCAFMAGGDVALVHSLEGFEDYPEYGARHLRELGFGEDDLLVACTEGGETPYVIGAVEEAARLSRHAPWFLYCNPDQLLVEHVERSRRIIHHPDMRKVNLTVGPMALAGSTRMQASTVLQLFVGYALLTSFGAHDISNRLDRLANTVAERAPHLQPLTEWESEVYANGGFVLYSAGTCPITVFTDTTERAPTFSLAPMTHRLAHVPRERPLSLSYVMLPDASTPAEAWRGLLGRPPRALEWLEIDDRTSLAYLEAFDFSASARNFRERQLQGGRQETVRIAGPGISIAFHGIERKIDLDDSWLPIERHTLLKMLLNQHSTLVMGRLNRYEGNIMTWVSPTNGKLVDRAARYVRHLLADRGIEVPYEEVILELFRQRDHVAANESVVMRVVERLVSGA